jgi:phytoene synthase
VSPDAYCEQKAAASGSSFYHSFRFLPPERRRAIIALYAFCREVDDAVDETIDAAVARIKLEWWRSQVAAIYGGVPQHPVAQALKPVVKAFDLPQEHLLAVIDGMAMDLDLDRYPDFGLLERYCDRVAGVVGLMSAEIFGYTVASTRSYARDLGIAFQLTNIIRDVGEDARRGRIYLPQDEMERFGVTGADLHRQHVTPGFKALMAAAPPRVPRVLRQGAGRVAGSRAPVATSGIDHGRDLSRAARRDRARWFSRPRSPPYTDSAAQSLAGVEDVVELLTLLAK